MDYKNFIELSLSQGVKLNIGQAIKDAFSMTGKHAGSYIGFTIVMFLITASASIIPFVGGVLAGILLSPALVVGFALFARKAEVENYTQFETFFDGFKTNYGQLIIVNLIIQMVLLGLSSIFLVSMFADLAPLLMEMIEASADPEYVLELYQEMGISMLQTLKENWYMFAAYFILTTVIQILYSLANYFVVFYGFGFWEAMESSRKLVGKVFGQVFVIMLIAGFIISLGTIATFGIGLLFFYPFVNLTSYAIFKQVAGFGDGEVALEDELKI